MQGQNAERKSPIPERNTSQRTVQFVTCHGCGKRGHYKTEYPEANQVRPREALSLSGVKIPALVEVTSCTIKIPVEDLDPGEEMSSLVIFPLALSLVMF